MNFCSCGGELLRHAITYYQSPDLIGIRYKCRECRKTFTKRLPKDEIKGYLYFSPEGRPTMKDWRYAVEA